MGTVTELLTRQTTAAPFATSKDAPLTNAEVDSNFITLAENKLERSANLSDLTDVEQARLNLGLGTASVTVSDEPPTDPSDGDLWWDPSIGDLLIYYDDGDSTQWVSATAGGGGASIVVSTEAPETAVQGALWWDPTVGALYIYYDDGDSQQWVSAAAVAGGAGSASVTVSAFPPSEPTEGDLWWNSTDGELYVFYDDGDSTQWVPATTGASAIGPDSNAEVNSLGVGVAPTGHSGEIVATGDITTNFSDDRLKTRTGDLENALRKINGLSAFYYEPNEVAQDLGYAKETNIGLSAQEVQRVYPEVVKPAPIDDQYLTIQYEKLVPVLIAAIQEQQSKIAQLELRMAKLEYEK